MHACVGMCVVIDRADLRHAEVLQAQQLLGAPERGDVTLRGGRFGTALGGATAKRDLLVGKGVALLFVERGRADGE